MTITPAELDQAFAYYESQPEQLFESVRRYVLDKYKADGDIAEDIATDVQIKVWRSIDPETPRPLKPFDPSKSKFSSWLYRVASTLRKNAHRDRGRATKRNVREVAVDNPAELDELSFNSSDPWNSEGKRWNKAKPTEDYYYEN